MPDIDDPPGPLLDAGAIRLRRSAALRFARSASTNVVLEELGLHLTSSHDVQDRLDDHRKIGSLTPTVGATAWMAKCNIAGHGSSCKFLLSSKPALGFSMIEAEAGALAWLGAGTTMDAAEHLQL